MSVTGGSNHGSKRPRALPSACFSVGPGCRASKLTIESSGRVRGLGLLGCRGKSSTTSLPKPANPPYKAMARAKAQEGEVADDQVHRVRFLGSCMHGISRSDTARRATYSLIPSTYGVQPSEPESAPHHPKDISSTLGTAMLTRLLVDGGARLQLNARDAFRDLWGKLPLTR